MKRISLILLCVVFCFVLSSCADNSSNDGKSTVTGIYANGEENGGFGISTEWYGTDMANNNADEVLSKGDLLVESVSLQDVYGNTNLSYVVKNNSNYTLQMVGVRYAVLDREENILGTGDVCAFATINSGKTARCEVTLLLEQYPDAEYIKIDILNYDSNGDGSIRRVEALDSDIQRNVLVIGSSDNHGQVHPNDLTQEQKYNSLSNSEKKTIGDFIKSRYDYYDKKVGEYTGDKYSDTIMQEAADKYGLSVSQVSIIWMNYYSY